MQQWHFFSFDSRDTISKRNQGKQKYKMRQFVCVQTADSLLQSTEIFVIRFPSVLICWRFFFFFLNLWIKFQWKIQRAQKLKSAGCISYTFFFQFHWVRTRSANFSTLNFRTPKLVGIWRASRVKYTIEYFGGPDNANCFTRFLWLYAATSVRRHAFRVCFGNFGYFYCCMCGSIVIPL